MNKYRKVYEQKIGSIPKDENGRSYEIHHIDGNRNNNDISNLKCVSIKEHYDIHYSQGDYGACLRMSQRMKISPQDKSHLSSIDAKNRLNRNEHHFGNSEWQKNNQLKRVANGTHPFLGGKIQSITQQRLSNFGIHPFQQQLKLGKHPAQQEHICPYCNKKGKGGVMFRYHFDKCKGK